MAVSPDGKRHRLQRGRQDGRLWDVETGKQLKEFAGHTEGVHGVAFSRDGKRLLSAGADGRGCGTSSRARRSSDYRGAHDRRHLRRLPRRRRARRLVAATTRRCGCGRSANGPRGDRPCVRCSVCSLSCLSARGLRGAAAREGAGEWLKLIDQLGDDDEDTPEGRREETARRLGEDVIRRSGLGAEGARRHSLLSLTRQLGPDEGGFAMVARYAGTSGGYLYGPQWVDRPPGLIALFAVADHLGPYGVRLTAAVLAVGLVAAVAWAAEAVGGRAAARWAAWTGFAFASSVLLQAQRLNGELAAATFVAVSIAAVLRALLVSTTRTRTALLGVLAGATAALAVLLKQSFVDAFVFAGVLLLAGSGTRVNRLTYRPSRVLRVARRLRSGHCRSRRGDGVVGPRPRRHPEPCSTPSSGSVPTRHR